jgi:hypothetical protein
MRQDANGCTLLGSDKCSPFQNKIVNSDFVEAESQGETSDRSADNNHFEALRLHV